MKTILSLSLIGNAILFGLVAYLTSVSPKSETANKLAVGASTVQSAVATSSPRSKQGLSDASAAISAEIWKSPADVQTWLRSNGAPLSVRYAVAQSMIVSKYRAEIDALRIPPGTSRWQLSALKRTPEQDEQLAAIHARQMNETKELFGADYARARFGEDSEAQSGIPAEKRVEIDRIARDYSKVRSKLGRARSFADLQLVEESYRADLSKVLSPEEMELYMAYESPEASRLQQQLSGLKIDDATYMKAFQASTQAKTPDIANSREFYLEESRAIEKAVGPEVAATIAINQDATFREIGKVYSEAGLPLSAVSPIYQAWLEFHMELGKQQNITPGLLTASQETLVRSYYDKMTMGLTPSQKGRFNITATGKFITKLLGSK